MKQSLERISRAGLLQRSLFFSQELLVGRSSKLLWEALLNGYSSVLPSAAEAETHNALMSPLTTNTVFACSADFQLSSLLFVFLSVKQLPIVRKTQEK